MSNVPGLGNPPAVHLRMWLALRPRGLELRREDGQGLGEYALVLALIAVLVIAGLGVLGGALNDVYQQIGRSVTIRAAPPVGPALCLPPFQQMLNGDCLLPSPFPTP